MKFAILCPLQPDSEQMRLALRLNHLEYLREQRHLILFGGPALTERHTPETMLIFVETEDQAQAEQFIQTEPYTASGQVFASVTVHPWSQVLPETESGQLEREIEKERARQQQA